MKSLRKTRPCADLTGRVSWSVDTMNCLITRTKVAVTRSDVTRVASGKHFGKTWKSIPNVILNEPKTLVAMFCKVLLSTSNRRTID